MCGRQRSASRNYATFIGILSSADLWRTGSLGVEQLSALRDGSRRRGGNRVEVDRPEVRAHGEAAARSHHQAGNCPALAKTRLERGTPCLDRLPSTRFGRATRPCSAVPILSLHDKGRRILVTYLSRTQTLPKCPATLPSVVKDQTC